MYIVMENIPLRGLAVELELSGGGGGSAVELELRAKPRVELKDHESI